MPPLVPVNAGHPTKECRSDGCDGTWLQRTLTLHRLDIAFPDLDVRVVRYADDALLMARTPRMAQKALERAKEVIEGELGLRVDPRRRGL